MLIGPLLFFQWTWTEKYMLCCFPTRPSAEGSVCAGGAEKKTASAVYFASGQARDAISSSQEREACVSCWSRDNERGGGNERETTSQLFAA